MRRKIFEKQIIDMQTGELSSITQVTVSKLNERFFMGRLTDSLDWLFELTGNEIKTIVFLLDLESLEIEVPNNTEVLMRLITLGGTSRQELLTKLNCSSSYLSRLLKRLEDKQWILRINKTDFLLNPKGFYKGSSKDVLPRIIEFERLCKAKKSSTINPEMGVDSSESKRKTS